MNAGQRLFLLCACLLYPLFNNLLFNNQTIIGLQITILLTPFYIYIVGWCIADQSSRPIQLLSNVPDNLVVLEIDLEDYQVKRVSAVWEFEEEVKEE